ncbi:NfeD family protein [Treponema sp. OMZ 840]|uniref:NfeD family protein n=1 Tax=Treponema sp. OMZ 840 TaxID=244313 RepID=UPI003D907D70
MKDVFIQNMPWLWFIIAVLCFVAEMLTMQLTTIWFAIAALITVFVSLLPIPPVLQVFLFLIIACTLLILTRPFVKKKLEARKIKTNADSLIGQKALVLKDIGEFEKGEIKIEGRVWTAKTADGTLLAAGNKCIIEKIEGVTCIVKSL